MKVKFDWFYVRSDFLELGCSSGYDNNIVSVLSECLIFILCVFIHLYILLSVCDNDLFVFHTSGGLQQPQPTMPQQSYPAAYPGLYQAKCSSVNKNNYVYTEELFVSSLLRSTARHKTGMTQKFVIRLNY